MTARTRTNRSLFVVTVLMSFFTCSAGAVTRAVMIPGRSAIFLMEGFSSAGQDPDPRRLYDTIAMAPIHRPEGDGKIVSTAAKDFTLVCTTRNSTENSVVCNIAIKPGARSKIEFTKAEYSTSGADAAALNQKLAGPGGRFDFVSSDGAMKIESTPEHFDFSYR